MSLEADHLNHPIDETVTIPVINEEVHLTSEQVITDRVRVIKSVSDETVTVEAPNTQDNVSVERIAVNEYVDEAPQAVRHEGDTMIIPVLQEVLVKKILLVEEIRITKTKQTDTESIEVTLRKEHVDVQRDTENL
ncbi:MAG: DUF2382 domain-containing protein [Tunicatimonas sp.]